MVYNFDTLIDRKNTNSYKWDSDEDEDIIPLWVADMDFQTAPCIIEALSERVKQGIFGYTFVNNDYYQAVINWFSRRHGWKIDKESIIYTSGVVPAISAIIKALTKPEDGVIVQTPVYNCFFSSIRNNGCKLIENPLKSQNDTFEMDFEDLEKKAALPEAKLLLLCNPHNPTGRVWKKEELQKVYEICKANKVIVVSDEIHCELVYKPYRYVPFAICNEEAQNNSITCVSPSKAFNIAGLQIANIVCKDEEKRKAIDKAININEVCDVNPFGVIATIKAYNEGEKWLEELKKYLYSNYLFLKDFFEKNLPQFPVTKLEGTYLVWVDFRSLISNSDNFEKDLISNSKVWLNSGTMYGRQGEGYMRINIACPKKRLEEGLNRIKNYIDNLK